MRTKIVMVLSSLIVVAHRGHAQTEYQRAANEAWNTRDWNRAVQAYRAYSAADTVSPFPHMRLGVVLTALGRYDEAEWEIKIAERKGAPITQVELVMALAEAGSGRVDSAFKKLDLATEHGLAGIPAPGDSLPPMQKLKSDARYASFLTAMDRNARPCMYDEHFKDFDFWVGSWDVRPKINALGAPARNEVTKIDDGCVVHESWTAPGSIGQSFNIYDRTRQKWFQVWVDNSGGLHEYNGTYRDNAMRYEGTTPASPTATGRVRTRLTFFRISADTVRQFSESERPDGTWRVNYDLIYTRRK